MSNPAYRIETPRLVIRCMNPLDGPLWHDAVLASIEHLKPWLSFAELEPLPLSERIALIRRWRAGFDLNQDFGYGIFSTDEQQILGSCGLYTRLGPQFREIGYWLRPEATGKGLMTEAAAALTRTAFEVDRVEKVEIHVAAGNERSMAIARRLGYTHEGTLRARVDLCAGQKADRNIFGLLAAEYPTSPAAQLSAEARAYDCMGERLY